MDENFEELLKNILLIENNVKELSVKLVDLEKQYNLIIKDTDKLQENINTLNQQNKDLKQRVIELNLEKELIENQINFLKEKRISYENEKKDIQAKIVLEINQRDLRCTEEFEIEYLKLISDFDIDFKQMSEQYKQKLVKSKLEILNHLEKDTQKLENLKNLNTELRNLIREHQQLAESEANLSKERESLENKEKMLKNEAKSINIPNNLNSNLVDDDHEIKVLKNELNELVEKTDHDELLKLSKKYRYLFNQLNERKNN
ncbi:unnamed protein product [Brachionus calyciflorus]|uniref:Uncharacterized protein n=1 Tax=Brachionus calyciflorus TaxID=104777 RepID=A0A813NFI1_9BILA|nr:unnamed protein product [Brachionus calyciflorus]